VRSSIREPFEVVKSKTVQLEHLQAAGEILRAVTHLYLSFVLGSPTWCARALFRSSVDWLVPHTSV
jgi:hypothetical protein